MTCHVTDGQGRQGRRRNKIDTTTFLCGPPSSKGQRQQYPSRFLYNVKKFYPEFVSDRTLHMFSGASDFGITTDLLSETADVKGDYRNLPFADNSMNAVLADPPYADHWANQWHQDLPKPKHILAEAARIVKPGGIIGILHIIIIPAYKELGVKRIALHPILTGPNNAIRVLNIFRKD